MRRKLISLILTLAILTATFSHYITINAATPLIAFPGAEGAGRYATGAEAAQFTM